MALSSSHTFRGILASPEGKFGVELETVSRRGCETAVKVQSVTRSIMCDSVTSWTVAHQALLPVGFARQEHWSGLPCPPPGALPDPGIEPVSPTLQVDSLPSKPSGKLPKLLQPAETQGRTCATGQSALPTPCLAAWGLQYRCVCEGLMKESMHRREPGGP